MNRQHPVPWTQLKALIGEHGLTLPPFTDPWQDFVRDDELRLREEVLGDVRADRRRALAAPSAHARVVVELTGYPCARNKRRGAHEYQDAR